MGSSREGTLVRAAPCILMFRKIKESSNVLSPKPHTCNVCGRLVKPLWGFLSDAFPIAGYRRRSWLLIVNLIGDITHFRQMPVSTASCIALPGCGPCQIWGSERTLAAPRVAICHAGTLGWIGLGLFTYRPSAALIFLLATNFGLAFGDVIVVRVATSTLPQALEHT